MPRDRLTPLLKWINIDQPREARRAEDERGYIPKMWRSAEVRRQLRTFVESFANSGDRVRAGRVRMEAKDWPPKFKITIEGPGRLRDDLSVGEIEGMRFEELRWLLNELLAGRRRVWVPSLHIDVEDDALIVSGTLPDVVLYLAARVVVDDDVKIAACPAPAPSEPGRPNDWKTVCGKLFVMSGGRGAPRAYCTDACKQRVKSPSYRAYLLRKPRRRS